MCYLTQKNVTNNERGKEKVLLQEMERKGRGVSLLKLP